MTLHLSILRSSSNPTHLTLTKILPSLTTTHPFSSSSSSPSSTSTTKTQTRTIPFRPRRPTPPPLLPSTLPPPKSTRFHNSPRRPALPLTDHDDFYSSTPDPTRQEAAEAIRYLRREQSRLNLPSAADGEEGKERRLTRATLAPPPESLLRVADYFSSEIGSTEDRIFERRALNVDSYSPEEGRDTLRDIDSLISDAKRHAWIDDDIGEFPPPGNPLIPEGKGRDYDTETDEDDEEDPNRRAYGPWAECVIDVSRVQKVMRGGTTVRYRALCIGGNLNGCGGYGVAKAHSPQDAVLAACRKTRRNIFFVDRYRGCGLGSDLVGKHNSCKVLVRATSRERGLRGNPLGCEILKYFGITDCTVKTHGNRNVYNVVYGMFKALATHESLEDVAMKRGKRLLNFERAKRLQIS